MKYVPGAQFEGTKAPGWNYNFTQLVSVDAYRYVPSGYPPPNQTPGEYVLRPPTQGLDQQFLFPDRDSPQETVYKGNPVGAFRMGKTSSTWDFTTWYMCQPDGGIYVPIAKIQWHLQITATWSSNDDMPKIVTSVHYAVQNFSFFGNTSSANYNTGGDFEPTIVSPEWTQVVPSPGIYYLKDRDVTP